LPAIEEMDHLLTVPLPTFVAERRRVVDILKRAGRRDDAAEIAKLVKPSLPVWVINQLARREGALIKRLGGLTADLRGAPIDRQGLRGDTEHAGASDYARIMAAHRDALKSLRTAAEKIVVASGHGSNPHTLERVVHTLRAGVANDQTRAAIEAGRLLSEVGEQDFASLMGPLGALRAGSIAAAPDPSHARKSDRKSDRAPQQTGKTPARPDDQAETREQARAQNVQEDRARAREQAVAARERARAQATAERLIERLRAQLATAEKAASQEDRALEVARRAFSKSEERAATARRALEAVTRELEAAQASVRAIAAE
jgi:hypothetical protein